MPFRGGMMIHSVLHRFGIDLVRWRSQAPSYPVDFDQFDREVVAKTEPYTMTSPERIVTLIDAVEYVVRAEIPGAFVECGVWKGGSVMAIALTLLRLGQLRDLYLYDTFEGMTEPTEIDVDLFGRKASSLLAGRPRNEDVANIWAYAPLKKVEQVLQETNYPQERIHYVRGPVEETIPQAIPNQIALLRLDTDWYQSTKHELEHLYPLLMSGGVLIVDDYGHHLGARQATDEYFGRHSPQLLCRVDYTGRMAVKH
jgi:hypothetical protein